MPKLSITFAATILSVAFAPTAQAYSTDPAPGTLQTVAQAALSTPQTAQADGTCAMQIEPVLASILGLEGDWRGDKSVTSLTAVACVADN